MTRTTVGPLELARHLPAMAADLPRMAREIVDLATGKPGDKNSIGLVFERNAQRHPQRPFLRFEGHALSYEHANARVNQYAHALTGLGAGRGDVVGILMTNRPDTLLIVLAVAKIGATAGLLNHNQRGNVLDHSVGLLESKVLVLGEECKEAVDSLSGPTPDARVVGSIELATLADGASTANLAVTKEIQGKERAFLIFTSGTTGLPKASVMTHHRWHKGMIGLGGLGVRLHGDDTLYCCLPLYHNNALTVALAAVLDGGATFALGKSFSASRFWDEAIIDKATAFIYIGEICRYLLNQPAKQTDRAHNVRLAVGNGMRPEIWNDFKKRFRVGRIVEFYGSSEGNVGFVNVFNVDETAGMTTLPHAVVEFDEDTGKAKRGSDGKLRKVRRGEIGLLLGKVTDRAPFDGYTDADATESKLVRDGFKQGDVWFDTGDLVRKLGIGHIAFVDRLGDTFRWKGENVATTEVEGAIGELPDVEQAVVYGVGVPGTDGKAGMAAVKLREGAEFDLTALAAHLYDRLPVYAVPLFVRIIDSVEQTSTFKSRKVELRTEGYTPGAEGRVYALTGRANGYVRFEDSYPAEVAAGRVPRG